MSEIDQAKRALEQYQSRNQSSGFHGTGLERDAWANISYQEGMLQAAIAQAMLLERIADTLLDLATTAAWGTRP